MRQIDQSQTLKAMESAHRLRVCGHSARSSEWGLRASELWFSKIWTLSWEKETSIALEQDSIRPKMGRSRSPCSPLWSSIPDSKYTLGGDISSQISGVTQVIYSGRLEAEGILVSVSPLGAAEDAEGCSSWETNPLLRLQWGSSLWASLTSSIQTLRLCRWLTMYIALNFAPLIRKENYSYL